MKHILFLVFLLAFLVVNSTAQVNISATSSGYNYDAVDPTNPTPFLGVPMSGSTPTASSGKTAGLSCFIEFGDGSFSFSPIGNHFFYNAKPNRDVISKITGVYSGGGKPPNHRSTSVSGLSRVSTYSPMNILGTTERVHITPNIGSVLASDTMIFVVTYKLEKNEINGNLVFLFNDTFNVFDNFKIGATFNDINTLNEDVNFVRTYFEEEETLTLTDKASNAKDKYMAYKDYISVNKLKNDGNEHNVFITLIPNSSITTIDCSKTMVKAILTADKISDTLTQSDSKEGLSNPTKGSDAKEEDGIIGETENELQVADKSHDPNFITVAPTCMLLPKENHTIDYHLHFQNTGLGGAPEVRVAISMPEGVDIANDITYPHRPSWYKIINGFVNNVAPYSNVTKDSLIFDFIKNPSMSSATATLEGMDVTKPITSLEKTEGDVWFTIKTKKDMPAILLAQASIVFFNNGGSANAPIITNTAVTQFRACCDCEKKCDKCKNKGRLWKWLFCKKC